MIIREYNESDEEQVKELISNIRAELGRTPIEKWEDFHEFFVFFVVEENKNIIATAAMSKLDENTGEIKRVYTHADYRENGIATKLLKECEKIAKENKINKLLLFTQHAAGFYQKNGYFVREIKDGTYMEKGL